MANISAAFGMRPVRHLDGSPWNGRVTQYAVLAANASAIYVGDPVIAAGDSGAAGVVTYGQDIEGMRAVSVAAAGDTLLGVVVGFSPLQTNLETLHRAASTARIAYVCDAPDVIFEIQEDSVGNNITATMVGLNTDIVYTAGSTLTGRSAVELDSSGTGTATAQLRILGLSKHRGNELGADANYDVIINEHEFKQETGL